MNGKKILKALGIAAVAAAVVPYRIEKDEEKDELTVQSLLWKLTNEPHPDYEDQRSTTLTFGFNRPNFEEFSFEATCGCCDDECCCEAECTCEETPAE